MTDFEFELSGRKYRSLEGMTHGDYCYDENGQPFQWMTEADHMQDVFFADRKAKGLPYLRTGSEFPVADLEDVVDCFELARRTSEVWERAVALSKFPEVDWLRWDRSDPKIAGRNELTHFISRFCSWFYQTKGMDSQTKGYEGVSNALVAVAKGQLRDDDKQGVIKVLRQWRAGLELR
jgi:hypothetical protein